MTTSTSRLRWQIPALIGAALLVSVAVAAPRMQGGGAHGPLPFERMDSDGDGQISRAEAEAFRAEQTAGMDANGDGFVSFEEAKAHRLAKREQRQRERFARLDKDGDGKVSMAEIDARATARFERLDENADGVISRDELPHRRGHGRHSH